MSTDVMRKARRMTLKNPHALFHDGEKGGIFIENRELF